jgi:phospholipid/cholesterol/gamma-HCH transport system substrate-binding protein
MSKKAPSTTQLLVITGFAFSCFGILLFMWVTFGGPTPFKARPYEIKIPFSEATQLAQQSDVRISGVSIGKVQSIDVAPDGQEALATVDIDDKYGPIPQNTRAILRTKTLLGETYIELTPGSSSEPALEDGGTLSGTNVAQSVQLDEIFRTFDPRTRAAFQEWMRNSAIAIEGQGQSLSAAFAQFGPTLTEFDQLFRVLDTQQLAVRALFRNGATALQAFRGRNGQLADLIQSSNAVFQTTATREQDIEALFKAFPTFLDEFRATLDRLRVFSVKTDPLMRQLVPAAEQLSPTLIAIANLSPEAEGFFKGLLPVINESSTGFSAARKLFRDQFPPLLRAADPFLRNLNPVITSLGQYKRELAASMANVAAATNALHIGSNEKQIHYLRVMGPFTPDSLATLPTRRTSNRTSAYIQPGSSRSLATGLLSFETRQCGSSFSASLNANTPNEKAFNERTGGDVAKANDLFLRLRQFAFANQDSTTTVPAPGCNSQAPFEPIFGNGRPATTYQHTFEQGG